MRIVQIEELGQNFKAGDEMKDYVNAGIYASGAGRTLSIINPDGISINVMISSDKVNWGIGTMNGTDLVVTTTQQIPVNNYSQWIQLQVADDAVVTNVSASIL